MNKRDWVIPAQFTRTSILLCSSPFPKPWALKVVVLQKSGDDIEPAIYWCFSPDDVVGFKVVNAASRLSFERDNRVQRYDCLAKHWAMARPIPRLPPVMRTWRARVDIEISVDGW